MFEPVELVDGDWSAGLILICDHARNALPAGYGSLGLPPGEFERHIAYDIGARAVTLELASRLGVPAVLSTFSRLLVDPNRGADDPTVIMRLSDGTVIPGNHPLGAQELESRLLRFHAPYRAAVDAALDRAFGHGVVPAVFSLHSFTPQWKGFRRPWHVAMLWDSDPRFTRPMLEALRASGDLVVGDNEPYDGALRNDTLYTHCTARGLAHALIEIRQDLIGDARGVEQWAERLAPMLAAINRLAELHEVRHFGSRTGPVEPRPNPPGPTLAAPAKGAAPNRNPEDQGMDDTTRTQLEAAAFRQLVQHLRERSDVQNIDMMNLAGFCRNCLSRWYQEEAQARGIEMDKAQAREIIYGMPYDEWTRRHQSEATQAQKEAFARSNPGHGGDHR